MFRQRRLDNKTQILRRCTLPTNRSTAAIYMLQLNKHTHLHNPLPLLYVPEKRNSLSNFFGPKGWTADSSHLTIFEIMRLKIWFVWGLRLGLLKHRVSPKMVKGLWKYTKCSKNSICSNLITTRSPLHHWPVAWKDQTLIEIVLLQQIHGFITSSIVS